MSETANLAELGMDSLMGAEIKQTLERGYDIVLGVQEIRSLTFGRLRELAGGTSAAPATPATPAAPAPTAPAPAQHKVDNAQANFATLGELLPVSALVELPSAKPSPDGAVAFMVHPIEGVCEPLREVARGVRGAVLGLQCTREAPLTDMAALAGFYVSRVRARRPRAPYTLLGYSYGAAVAFEMALQLERAGADVRLVLVDGSPEYVATHTRRGRRGPARSAARDEAEALAYFAQLFGEGEAAARAVDELERLPSRTARAERVADMLAAGGAGTAGGRHTRAALFEAALSFYDKLAVGDSYRPSARLRGPVRLFTARDNYVTLDPLYGLREACAGEVQATQLPADHRSILTGTAAQTIADQVSEWLEH